MLKAEQQIDVEQVFLQKIKLTNHSNKWLEDESGECIKLRRKKREESKEKQRRL